MLGFVSVILFIELCAVGSVCFYLLSKLYEELTEAEKKEPEQPDNLSKEPAYIYTPFNLDFYGCSYAGILTILDYETPIDVILSKIKLDVPDKGKIIMDNLLKQGVSKKRFIGFCCEKGKINLSPLSYLNVSSLPYFIPDEKLISKANSIWREKGNKKYLIGSIVTPSLQKEIIGEEYKLDLS